MAWSTPRTWVPSEVVTAGNMNTYISDDLAYLKSSIDNLTIQTTNYSLPLAAGYPQWGRVVVKAANAITISRSGSDTIWSTAAAQTSVSAGQGDAYTFASDGINQWYVV